MIELKQVVIVAGGYGYRMAGVFPGIAKSSYVIGERFFLNYLLDWIIQQGFNKVHLCLGIHANQLTKILKPISGLNISFDIETEPKGVAGALLNSCQYLDTNFLLLYGDVLPRTPVKNASKQFLSSDYYVQLLALPRTFTNEQCNLVLDDTNKVIEYKQTPYSTHLDNGMTFVRKKAINIISQKGFACEKEWYAKLANDGRLSAFITTQASLEVGSPEGYMVANKKLGKR